MGGSGPDDEFKVTDRRRRTEEETRHPEAPRPLPESSASSRVGEAAEAEQGRRREPNLEALVMMLATSAVMAMGGPPDLTTPARRDLAMAAEAIDLLVLLRDKTQGNRTAEETQLLDDVIGDLQLRYVAVTTRSG